MAELFTEGADNAPQPATTDNQPAAAPPAPVIPPELQAYVGEGKKYGTIEAALASIVPAQTHITNIETENAEYKLKMESNDKLDTILNKLSQPAAEPAAPTSAQPLNVGDIVNAVKQDLQQEATLASKASNRASVEAKLTEKYGEAAPTKAVEIASTLGMTVQDLTSLCESSPTAALQLMGVDNTAQPAQKLETDIIDGKPPVGELPPHKSIMFGANSSEILNAWRAAAPAE